MPEQCYLAVDLGAESGRVIAGLFDGRQIRLEELHRFSNGPVSVAGTMRWNVLGLWSDIQTGLAKAAEKYGERIVSVGVDTWGVDFALLGKGDEIIGQPYHYRDSRTDGILQQAVNRVPRREIFASTGLQFMPINTLYQLIALRQTHPHILDVAERFLMMADLFHWLLCGSQVVEFTNATTTQCLDPATGDWAFDLLRRFDLPTGIFPEVVAPGTVLGKLRTDVSEMTGLGRVDVIAPATHDTGSAVAAVPSEQTGSTSWAYISSGTWSLMGLEVDQAVLSDKALELNVTNEGGIDGTFRLLKNIMGLWLVQQCRRSFERAGRLLSYDEIQRVAVDAQPFRSLVDPDDGSFLAPDDMPAAIGSWCESTGQPSPHSDGQFIRCALESLALKYRMVLGQLEELTGSKVEVIHIVGGGTQNRLLNQFTANACGCPVVTGPIEATALGNVLVQARTAGQAGTLSDMRDIVRRSTELQRFEPADRSVWQEAYGRFHELLSMPRH